MFGRLNISNCHIVTILQNQGLFGCLRTVIKGDSRGRAWRGQTGLSWTRTTIGRSNTWWRSCHDEDDDGDGDDDDDDDGGGDHHYTRARTKKCRALVGQN